MMNKSVRIEPAMRSHRLLAFGFDLLCISLSTVLLFFLSLYAIVGPIVGYQDKCNYMVAKDQEYGLTIGDPQDYVICERVIQDFYFNYFSDDIENDIHRLYPKERYSSIVHIYNVFVLNLPLNPTPEGDKFKGDLFQYKISEEGVVLVDEVGIKRPDMSGMNYENSLKQLFYTKYSSLPQMLVNYLPEYNAANSLKNNVELGCRIGSASISVLIFALILPLIFKNGQTLGFKLEHVALVNSKNGFKIPFYKNIIRMFALYTLPVFGFALNNRYGFVIFIIFPLFISVLLMLFRESGADLQDLFARTTAVDMDNSLLFSSAGEASLYEKNPEHQNVEDEEYLKALESVDKFDLSESRDESLKKDTKG